MLPVFCWRVPPRASGKSRYELLWAPVVFASCGKPGPPRNAPPRSPRDRRNGSRIHPLLVVGRDGSERLWLRAMDSSSARPLAGTAGAADSRFIGFFSGGKLAKIDIQGGPPT